MSRMNPMDYRKSPRYTGFRMFDAVSREHGVDFDAILFAGDAQESRKLTRKMQKDSLKHWTALAERRKTENP